VGLSTTLISSIFGSYSLCLGYTALDGFSAIPRFVTLNDPEELFHVKVWLACRCEVFHALLTWLCVGAWPSQCTSRHVPQPGLQSECLIKSSSAGAFSHLSLGVLFITTITLAVNNDDGSN